MNSSTFSINTLSDEDTLYLKNVMIDLRSYVNNLHTCTHKKSVLIFPPVNNFRRFLIHHLVDTSFRKEELSTLSIGALYARRTVVYPSVLKPMDVKYPEVIPERKTPVAKKVTPVGIYRPPALRSNETDSSHRKERKTRKPDMQIYVPRGRRLFTPGGDHQSQDEESNDTPTSSNQKNSNADATHTPKKQKMVSASSSPEKSPIECVSALSDSSPVVPVEKSKDDLERVASTTLIDEEIEIIEVQSDHEQTKVMEDLSLNTSAEKRNESSEASDSIVIDEAASHPSNYLSPGKENVPASTRRVAAAECAVKSVETSEKNCDIDVSCVDESHVQKRTEESIVEISSTEVSPSDKCAKDEKIAEKKSPCDKPASTSVSAKENSSLNVNECEWDELFDDEGEYVDKSLINELMTAIGKVSVQQAAQDYKPFQTVEERTSDGGCVVEIYGFPSEFKTEDLLAIFATHRSDPAFQIVWVDDTHALAVFSSPTLADKVLNTEYPFVKTRPIKNAIPKSRMKAQSFVLPPVSRPKTCVSLARRLVSGHLGMKINVTDQQKAAEKKILSDAREKRRLIAKQRQEAWEGSL